jgi:hypothetical protein
MRSGLRLVLGLPCHLQPRHGGAASSLLESLCWRKCIASGLISSKLAGGWQWMLDYDTVEATGPRGSNSCPRIRKIRRYLHKQWPSSKSWEQVAQFFRLFAVPAGFGLSRGGASDPLARQSRCAYISYYSAFVSSSSQVAEAGRTRKSSSQWARNGSRITQAEQL